MDIDIYPDIWALDFLLRKPLPDRTVISLVRSIPIPDNDTNLRKLFWLRILESELTRQPISDGAVLWLEELAKVEFARGVETLPDTMRRAYFAVAVECTVAHLKNGVNGKYEFHEAEKKVWKGMVGRVEKLGLGSDELWVWKEDVETALWDDCVCDRVQKNGEGIDARKAVEDYIRIEREKMGPSFLDLLASRLKDDKDLRGAVRVTSAHEVAGEEVKNADQVFRFEPEENDVAAQCDMGIGRNNYNGNVDHVAREDVDVDYVGSGSGLRKEFVDRIVELVEGKERNIDHPEGEATKNVDQGAELESDNIGHVAGKELVKPNKETEKVIESMNQIAGDDGCNDEEVGPQEMECVYQAARGNVRDINQAKENEVLPVAEEVAPSLCVHKDADESLKGRIHLRAKLVGLRRPGVQVLGCQRGAKIANSDETEVGLSPRKNNLPHSSEFKKVREALESSRVDLHEVVKDPLPEALQLAEVVCRDVAKSKCQDPAEDSRVEVDVFICDVDGVVQPPACRANNVSMPSLMERNSTAHTFTWDDSIDGSYDKPAMNHLPTPRAIRVPPLNLYQAKKRRRAPRKWSLLEEDVLRAGVEEYGKGNWKAILHAHRNEFEDRTEVDLKDKWRNLSRG